MPPPSDKLHELVYEEVILEFTQNTKCTLSADGYTELQTYLIRVIYPLLDEQKIEWAGKVKKYVLACAAGLARAAEQLAEKKKTTVIDKAIIEKTLKGSNGKDGLLGCWERVCPLPERPDRGMRLKCTQLRGYLKI